MTTRVAFVCQWYPPEPVPTPRWIATGLAEVGFEVEVLTGIPNYPSGQVVDGYSPWRSHRDERDGLAVRRTPLYPSHDARGGRRILNYLSWAATSALLGQRLLRRADVSLVYSSPATAALPAMVARRLWGTPYVLLIQDVWPDSVFASGFLNQGLLGRVARRALTALVALTYRKAEHIAVISPGMIDLLVSRGVPREKLSLVYNWVEAPDPSDPRCAQDFRTSLGLTSDDFMVLYAGNHGAAQALQSVVDAFASTPDELRCHLVMVGDGMEKAALIQRAADNPRVHFVDPRPRSDMPDLMSGADALLVSLADQPLFEVTMPSKVQSILAAGIPAVVSGRGDIAAVVRQNDAGVAAAPEDPGALALEITRLARLPKADRTAMGARGRTCYERHMSRSTGLASLARLLRTAVDGKARVHRNEIEPAEGTTR